MTALMTVVSWASINPSVISSQSAGSSASAAFLLSMNSMRIGRCSQSRLRAVHAMVRSKARGRPDQRGAGDSALPQESKNLVVQKIVIGAGVLVEMNRYFPSPGASIV